MSGEVESGCAAVFSGKSDRFAYTAAAPAMHVDVVPVRDADASWCSALIVNPARDAAPSARV